MLPATKVNIIYLKLEIYVIYDIPGDEITLQAKVAGGDVLHVVKCTWIKGKWNSLTKGDRFEMWEDERNGIHFLKFKSPKQSDTGMYKLKASTQNGEDECTFQITVGRKFILQFCLIET